MTREGTINFSVSTPFNSAGLICFLFFIYYLNLLTTLFPLCVYVEKAFGRTELSVLFYMLFFILHVPLLVVILHAFFQIYNYCIMFINTYNYCYILRWFGFFNVARNLVKRKCVYKFNKKIDSVSLLIVFYLLAIYFFFYSLN